jgi:hypothetical protein
MAKGVEWHAAQPDAVGQISPFRAEGIGRLGCAFKAVGKHKSIVRHFLEDESHRLLTNDHSEESHHRSNRHDPRHERRLARDAGSNFVGVVATRRDGALSRRAGASLMAPRGLRGHAHPERCMRLMPGSKAVEGSGIDGTFRKITRCLAGGGGMHYPLSPPGGPGVRKPPGCSSQSWASFHPPRRQPALLLLILEAFSKSEKAGATTPWRSRHRRSDGLRMKYDAAQERGEVATRADQNLLPEQKKVDFPGACKICRLVGWWPIAAPCAAFRKSANWPSELGDPPRWNVPVRRQTRKCGERI